MQLLWQALTLREHAWHRRQLSGTLAAIRSVADFQKAVPLRTYEDLWRQYLRDAYPVFQDLTWPGRIPYLALTSGTSW